MKPRLFLGTRSGGILLEADVGFTDAGVAYNLYAKTERTAPAGVGGECAFVTLYLALVHTLAAHLRVTPTVDGRVLETKVLALASAGGAERRVVYEVNLSEPLVLDGIEEGRFAPRGTWIEVAVETAYEAGNPLLAEQIVEGVEVEFEVVREGRMEAASV